MSRATPVATVLLAYVSVHLPHHLFRLTLMTCALSVAACAPGESDQASRTPAATSAIGGTYTLEELRLGAEEMATATTVTIDTDTASVEVDTGCNTFLGSYSAFADGEVSFTLVGGTNNKCGQEKQDLAITTALSAVQTWTSEPPETIVLESEAGDRLTLRRL